MTTDDRLGVGSPRMAEDSVAVSADETPLVAETGAPGAAEEVTPVGPQGTPVAGGDTPPVATPDIFLDTERRAPRTSARSRSKHITVVRRIRTVVAYMLLLAILGAAGVAAFALVQGTWMVTPVLSGSMRPGLSVGGIVVSQRVAVDSLHVRDVIIFRDPFKPSEQIVHRIVRISKGPGGKLQFNTQGDANNVRDPWTLTIEGDSIYRARWSVPLVGYLAIAYQNHRGFFLLGAGIVLILIAIATFLEARQGRSRKHARRTAHTR